MSPRPSLSDPLAPLHDPAFRAQLVEAAQPPPSYDMVVDPRVPIPNSRNPYDPINSDKESDISDFDDEADHEDNAEQGIIINAPTFVKGSGNIMSLVPIDSGRIAGLIASLLRNQDTQAPTATSVPAAAAQNAGLVASASDQAHINVSPSDIRSGRQYLRKRSVKVVVTCGTTVYGDRNIVGPGLSEIAKQVMMAPAGRILRPGQTAEQARAATQFQAPAQRQSRQIPTPPLSPGKRKAEEEVDGENDAKRVSFGISRP